MEYVIEPATTMRELANKPEKIVKRIGKLIKEAAYEGYCSLIYEFESATASGIDYVVGILKENGYRVKAFRWNEDDYVEIDNSAKQFCDVKLEINW